MPRGLALSTSKGDHVNDDLCYLPASEALALFRERELSPVELMEATIARVEAVDPVVNALPIRFFDEAIEAARAAEARYAGRGPEPRPSRDFPWPSRTRSRWRASPAPRAR